MVELKSEAEDLSAPALVTERFGRRYHRRRPWALRDVSIEIAHGRITALVGPNGAGKSTLIRACLGFEQPNEGRVLVGGRDPRSQRAAAVRQIGYVPQGGSLYRALTVDDHFVVARAARPEFDRDYAVRTLRRVGIAPERRVSELSGGEQAQVALALALGTRAPLLLLDEPLASLDPLARRDFLALLVEDVRSRNATAVLSSHVVTDVEQACDWLLVLAAGRVALDESVVEARQRFRVVSAIDRPVSVVGSFMGTGGEQLTLVEGGDGRPATLEEIVLGHLAAGRPRLAEVA